MRAITLEEHFVTGEFLRATGLGQDSMPPALAAVRTKLLDIGAGRIAAMDEADIQLQVLSLAALGIEKLDPASANSMLAGVNDELHAAVVAHPDRFAGFATLALEDPQQAAKELDRCIGRLGFRGWIANGTADGTFLDDPRFLPVWEAAAHLGIPVYVHPAPPPKAVADIYFSGLPGELGHALSIAGWGWHAETGLHLLRLIVSGLFDRLPKLQVIVGHMGEGVPYALARSSHILSQAAPGLRQPVAAYLKSNVHITTSGYFTRPPFVCCEEVVGLDRMMYSVDYPFSSNRQGAEFLRSLALDEADGAAFAYGNAQRLLGIAPA